MLSNLNSKFPSLTMKSFYRDVFLKREKSFFIFENYFKEFG